MTNQAKFDAEAEAKQRVETYMEGWKAGVVLRALTLEEIHGSTFALGWMAGADARNDAYERACAFNGINPLFVEIEES